MRQQSDQLLRLLVDRKLLRRPAAVLDDVMKQACRDDGVVMNAHRQRMARKVQRMIYIRNFRSLARLSLVRCNGAVNCSEGVVKLEGICRRLHKGLHVLPFINVIFGFETVTFFFDQRGGGHAEQLREPDQIVDVGLILITLPGGDRLEGDADLFGDLLLCEFSFFTKHFDICSDVHITLS